MKLKRAKNGQFVRTRKPWTVASWNDGYVDNRGRFRVYRPDCPNAFASGYCLRSHVVWWLHTGKEHPSGTELHHKNHNRLDDAFDNLEPLENRKHQKLHKARPVTIVCPECRKDFIMPRWRVRSRPTKYCSQGCYHKYRKMRPRQLRCLRCRTPFTVTTSRRVRDAKYCSLACYRKKAM